LPWILSHISHSSSGRLCGDLLRPDHARKKTLAALHKKVFIIHFAAGLAAIPARQPRGRTTRMSEQKIAPAIKRALFAHNMI
jgi:hypothetical protein